MSDLRLPGETEVIERARDEALAAIARWIGKSGYVRHISDPGRAWAFALREAEGLMFDDYGGLSDAIVKIDLYLHPELPRPARPTFRQEPEWRCDWHPDDLNPGPDCPYCAGDMCARFDGLRCTHDRRERHGYLTRPDWPVDPSLVPDE